LFFLKFKFFIFLLSNFQNNEAIKYWETVCH
jgi:hypothetical protein